MADTLTPLQYRTLSFIAECPGGRTALLPVWWRDRHHQALLRHGFVRLRADPFRTKAIMLRGRITPRGRKAVQAASATVRAQAKAAEEREYVEYVREQEAG